MTVEVKVPTLGESIVEATVGKWLKQAGTSVSEGEPLVELETDKVNLDVVAPASGVLQSITRQEGDTVNIGEVLAVVDTAGAAATAADAESPDAAPETAPQAAPAPAPAPAPAAASEAAQEAAPVGRSTPLARRVAAEHGVDLHQVHGSGPSGRVMRDDVTTYLGNATPSTAVPTQKPAAQAAAPSQATPASNAGRPEERVRMSRRRQTIARRLVEAQQTAAMLTTFNEIDMSAIMALRTRRREQFKERNGIGLGFMSFFTKAVVGALKAFPRLNAEIQGDEMVLKQYYDIGIAVGADEGLVVPVVRDADRLSFAEIERQIAELAAKARDNTLSLSELQGGTFTITNGGIFGSLLSTPILNTPQVGILGMHTIQQRPVASNGEVVIRPMMYVALSYDHRIVDGSEAVRFLVRVKELAEDPETLLLEG